MQQNFQPSKGEPEIKSLNFNFDEIDPSKKNTSARNIGGMTMQQTEQVILRVQQLKKMPSPTSAMALITGVSQVGGTNRNTGSCVNYSYGGFTLNGAELTTICTQVGGTSRQFARAMANVIVKFAMKFDEPGDLSRQMKLEHPNLSIEDSYWCSNFRSKNPNCPEVVQLWLKDNFNKRFTNEIF